MLIHHIEFSSNNIELCCISETWLHSATSSSLLCPPGIARKDRQITCGGGVEILCQNDWRMENISDLENNFECVWLNITKNSVFSVATIYHPPGDYSYDAMQRSSRLFN